MDLNRKLFRLAAPLLGAIFVSSAHAVWDFSADFSVTNGNPNGAWSYGIKQPSSVTGPLSVFPTSGSSSDWQWWHDPAILQLGAPAASKNISSVTINGVAPGEASLHPGAQGEVATVRWTAPNSNVYRVYGYFAAGDGGSVDVYIGAPQGLYLDVYGTYSRVDFDFTQNLNARDRLDFMVGHAGSFFYDSTPLHLTIEAVPEPMTLLAVGVGLAVIWRRRR